MKTVVIIDLHCDATMPAGAQEFGGGNVYSRGLLQYFIRDRIPCIYITRRKYSHLPEKVALSNTTTLIRLDLGDFGPDDMDQLQEHYQEALHQIIPILRSIKTDLILHSCYWQSGYVAMKLAETLNLEYIHTIFSNGKRIKRSGVHHLNRSIEERISTEETVFHHAKKLLCSSEAEMQDMRELYQISDERLIMTGLPVHDAFEYPVRLRDGQLRVNSLDGMAPQYLPLRSSQDQNFSTWRDCGAFLYFGRLAPIKGVPLIVFAWLSLYLRIGNNTPPLWIAGGSMDQIVATRKQIIEKAPAIQQAEEAGKLIWWGNQEPEGISALMTKSLVVVTHSKIEAGGLMILEAMAHRLPVIATPCGYARTYIHDWKEGFLVEYGDTNLLAFRMEHFVRQPLLSAEMGQAAYDTYQRAKAEFRFWEKHKYSYALLEELPTVQTVLPSEQAVWSKDNPSLTDEYIAKFAQNVYGWDGPVFISRERETASYRLWRLEYRSKSYLCKQWRTTPCIDALWYSTDSLTISAGSRTAAENSIQVWNEYHADMNKYLTIFSLPKETEKHFDLNRNLALLDQICVFAETAENSCLNQSTVIATLGLYWEQLHASKIATENSLQNLWHSTPQLLADVQSAYRSVGKISDEMFYKGSLLHFGMSCYASFGFSQASLLVFAYKRHSIPREGVFAATQSYNIFQQKSILQWMLCFAWEEILRQITLAPYINIEANDIALIQELLTHLEQYNNPASTPESPV